MSLRVVIADDHPVVLFAVRSVIERSGVGTVVAEAGSAEGLIGALARTPCDVVVTDFSMPGGSQVDGYTMIGMIRREYPQLPIVLLTMMRSSATLRTVLASGVSGLVEKGGAMDELPLAVAATARGRRYVSTAVQRRLQGQELETPARRMLSPREAEVVRLLASGMSVSQIAQRLHRSITTISRQKGDAMRKLGLISDAELFTYVHDSGVGA